jgi:predicted lipid-binding transport protein (Tim44 family)
MPDTQVLEILVIAMIAGIILFRLYTVLGRRTGHEPPPPVAGRLPGSDAAPPPSVAEPVKQGHGLLDIQQADPGFDSQHFLQGARTAYELIIGAFHKGNRAALKPLLSGEVFAAFDSAITARGDAPPPAFDRLKDARIVGASLNGGQAEITIAFVAAFADNDVTDVWSFARRVGDENPNWLLVATSGELPE